MGEPEPEPESELDTEGQPECTDSPLPARWSQGGIYECDWYFNHGGVAYCAHEAHKEHCCFCRGPNGFLLDVTSTRGMAAAHKLSGASLSRRQRFLHQNTILMQLGTHNASLEL